MIDHCPYGSAVPDDTPCCPPLDDVSRRRPSFKWGEHYENGRWFSQ